MLLQLQRDGLVFNLHTPPEAGMVVFRQSSYGTSPTWSDDHITSSHHNTVRGFGVQQLVCLGSS